MRGIEREEEEGKDVQHGRTLLRLAKALWPEGRMDLKIRFLLAISALVLAKCINVAVPLFYKQAVDQLSSTALDIPIALVFAYGIARLMHQLFGELRDLLFIGVSQNAQRRIALSTFQHLHRLSLRFHLSRRTGGLSRVIERGIRGIQFVLAFMAFNTLPTLLEICLVSLILWWAYGAFYAGVCFGTIAIYIAFTLLVTTWRLKFRRRMNKSDTEANAKSIDSLINYETVKVFGNEEYEYNRYDSALADYEIAAVQSQWSLTFLNAGQGSIIAAGLILLMAKAAVAVKEGLFSVGDFVLVNSYLIQLYLPLGFLGFVYREMKHSLTDMEKMFQLIDMAPDIKDKVEAKDLALGPGAIGFSNVSFSYDNGRRVLENLSFDVPAGKTVAIVGPSGSGKSTLSRLLLRFYDVTDGKITIDGMNIQDVKQQSLRQQIGIVPQDTVLFNESIYYNIAYGRPVAGDLDIKDAARLARIHDFVESLPEAYQTEVGERGLKLSGGEKQRVAIARAILKQPNILIFDEATSALDSHTEKEIQASLNAVSKDTTTLLIAHRLSTVVDADEILVLDQGRIVERGSHRALLALKGSYFAMWKKQETLSK